MTSAPRPRPDRSENGGAAGEPVVLASANPKKVAELRQILGEVLDLRPRPPLSEVPDVVEDAPDFVGNARLKAAALVEATGMAALADDSGLEVDALDGAPGVISARYAGEPSDDAANVAKLLAALEDHSDPADRGARFRCVLVLRRPDGSEVVAEGSVEGHIAAAARGDGGFGYDPVFVPEGTGQVLTFAEMDPAAKHAISHRGRALAHLLAQLTAS